MKHFSATNCGQQHCLPIFRGPVISKRLSLMVTDGYIQEYSAFINNCGSSKAFPNAIHTLYYFHFAVQRIIKRVYPCVLFLGSKFIHNMCIYACVNSEPIHHSEP